MAIADLKARLLSERDRLKSELAELEHDLPRRAMDEPGYGNHLADDATDTEETEKVVALERHLQAMLDSVKHALEKMDEGTYGICEECGQPINPERLQALPQATMCVECKSRAEKAARIGGRS